MREAGPSGASGKSPGITSRRRALHSMSIPSSTLHTNVRYRENAMKLATLGLVLVLPFALGTCNTAKGIGEDASAAGQAVSDAAKKLTGSKSDSDKQPAPAQGTSGAPASSTRPPETQAPK
jgi:predicted small secreted protein